LVLCVNLFMIFITDNEIDMVLNSLALEFILHVDEELKAFLFEILKEEEEEEDFCLLLPAQSKPRRGGKIRQALEQSAH
jgi:hypothetical protein